MPSDGEIFVDDIEQTFGPWRGASAGVVMANWIDAHNITSEVLNDVFRDLVEHRAIEVVNTISIPELKPLISQHRQTPKLIEDTSQYLSREEGLERLEILLRDVCRRRNVKTAPVDGDEWEADDNGYKVED